MNRIKTWWNELSRYDREDYKMYIAIIGTVLVVLTIIGLCVLSTVPVTMFVEYQYCQAYQELNSEFEFQWIVLGGCRIKLENGYWIHVSEYKYMYGDFSIHEYSR